MATVHEQRRQRAIDRYLAGDPIEDICRELACAKSWLYKWRDRYLATDPSWSAARSRRPSTTPTKTPQRTAQVVVALRQTLAQQALAQQGIKPVPSQRTIYRILHRYTKEVTATNHHHTAVHQRAKLLTVLTEPHS